MIKIKIELKDGIVYDIVEETEDIFFYVGTDGFNKYVAKHKVVNVERYEVKKKHKKSILLNILIVLVILLLIGSYYV